MSEPDEISTYSALRRAVKAAVDALDPEGLLRMGAPDDEYDSEVDEFTARLAQGDVVTSDSVRAIWARWFGSSTRDQENLEDLARRLLTIQSRWCEKS